MIRVATYNLYLGADLLVLFGARSRDELSALAGSVHAQLRATRFEERAVALARILARTRPDLVGLQEVTRWGSAPGSAAHSGAEEVVVDFLPVLLAALEDAGCGYDVHAVNANYAGRLPVGDAVFSLAGANVTLVRRDASLEVVGEGTLSFETAYQVVTGVDGMTFPVARSLGWVDVVSDGRPVRFINAHLEAYDAVARAAQRAELLAVCESSADTSLVVVGDFNATPEEVGMPPSFVDAWLEAGGDPAGGLTCGQAADLANPDSSLDMRIDYVFARGLSVDSCEVVGHRPEDRTSPHDLWPSDHAGVVADLS